MNSSNWLDQQYDWIFNTDLSELGYFESHQNEAHDPLFEGINEQCCWVDDNKEFEIDEFIEFIDSYQWGDHDDKLFEFGESDLGVGNFNEKFHSQGNIFEEIFEKLNEIFKRDDDIYSENEFGAIILQSAQLSDTDFMKIADKLHDLTCEPVKPCKEKEKILREEDDLYVRCRKPAFKMIGFVVLLI